MRCPFAAFFPVTGWDSVSSWEFAGWLDGQGESNAGAWYIWYRFIDTVCIVMFFLFFLPRALVNTRLRAAKFFLCEFFRINKNIRIGILTEMRSKRWTIRTWYVIPPRSRRSELVMKNRTGESNEPIREVLNFPGKIKTRISEFVILWYLIMPGIKSKIEIDINL